MFIRQKKVKVRFQVPLGNDIYETKKAGMLAGSLISDDRNSKSFCNGWCWE
jgi:hypothetical protein